MPKMLLRPGDPAGGAYSAPPDLLAGFKGPTSKGREGNGREGGEEEKVREGEGRRGGGREGKGGKVLPPPSEGSRRHW